ncbi:fructose symporter [Exophiala xenobiotica]|nr:fructose symporter [Exophiala xenobiotica]
MGDDFPPAGPFNKDSEKIDHAEQLDGPVPAVSSEADALRIAKEQHWQADQFIEQMEQELEQAGYRNGLLGGITFKNPKHFTWAMVFLLPWGVCSSASTSHSLAVPTCSYLMTFALQLDKLGAALEAGSINYAMMVTARLILGVGVGIETGTVPIYVAESVERRLRGNLVSLYQFNIALGEVLGFVVAAIFLKVKGNWRYILGSSVVFSIIMFVGRTLDAYRVWKRIRGVATYDSRAEFFVMKATVDEEIRELDVAAAMWSRTGVILFL